MMVYTNDAMADKIIVNISYIRTVSKKKATIEKKIGASIQFRNL